MCLFDSSVLLIGDLPGSASCLVWLSLPRVCCGPPIESAFELSSRSLLLEGFVMFMRFAMLLAGLATISSSVGCCCLGGGYNRCSPCGQSPCSTGGCSPAGGGGYQSFYPQGAYTPGGVDSTAFAPTPILSAAPVAPGNGYAATAMLPSNPLPTY